MTHRAVLRFAGPLGFWTTLSANGIQMVPGSPKGGRFKLPILARGRFALDKIDDKCTDVRGGPMSLPSVRGGWIVCRHCRRHRRGRLLCTRRGTRL